MKKILMVLAVLAVMGNAVFAGTPPPEDPVDHLALAMLMFHDGRYDKAVEELILAGPATARFDGERYHTLQGVIAAKTGRYHDAVTHYQKAIEATLVKDFTPPKVGKERRYLFAIGSSTDPEQDELSPVIDTEAIRREKLEKLHLTIAQAYYKVEDYAHAALALDLAGSRGDDRAELFILRAECYWQLQDYHRAFGALSRGQQLFPADVSLEKRKFAWYAELGLYQAAGESARRYMAMIEPAASDFIFLAQLYDRANQRDEAISLLEKARAIFPGNAKIPMLIGQFYMKNNMNHNAAALFRNAAAIDPKYLQDAVEMLRRVKAYPQAIYLNSRMADSTEKLKMKVAIALDRGEFEKVIGLRDGLERYNLLDDDAMRYAFAYSCYMTKDYQGAEEQIQKINDRALFTKGMALRNNIEKCREESTECVQ